MTAGQALLYGATGYIGRLCARRTLAAGIRPVLAGRDAGAVTALGDELGLPTRAFDLADSKRSRAGLAGVAAVLNCAGPFDATAGPLVRACIDVGAHYLDLAGEVPEMETCAALDTEAARADVMVLPGAGFGVVPTDCLAAHLHRRLPDAARLELAFQTVGGLSRGTAMTLLRDLAHPGVRRAGGSLVPQRAATRTVTVDFGRGPVRTVTNPWRADLFTAGRSTGIADIDTYTALSRPVAGLMRVAPRMPWLFDSRAWRAAVGTLVRRLPAGPSDEQLAEGSSHVWGRATAPDGSTVEATLQGPEAYEFTARTATLLLQRVLSGQVVPGFQTPATAYGPDLVLEVDGVHRHDSRPATT